ncbi:putative Iad1-indole-3-acetaldehyde dehydrogenase [Atractiella rhizophila]|nr:putative Iad1-indole-3-acetaldehyde dehydrogenase [Atractiella rhizophila]
MPIGSLVNLSFHGGAVKSSTFSGGLFINNEFVSSESGKTFQVANPSTGKPIAEVSEASAKDVDTAVDAAEYAFKNVWGEKVPGYERGKMLFALAEALEKNADELAAIESLDNGKAIVFAKYVDITEAASVFRYYGGWADKNHGQVIEVNDQKLAYTRHEPIGVCGQIIPWNFPILMFSWKLAPALATGNTVVLKTAEQTPLSALKICEYIAQIFPPGVVNVLSGFGPVAGAAIASHMKIEKVAFTGSTLTGRTIMKAAAASNLKKVTLELGGKSPNIIFDDADLDQAVKWSSFGLFFNGGQCCHAGSRVYVQETIYDKFMEKFVAHVKSLKVGDPFQQDTFQGPQVSQLQFDRIMNYIKIGKEEGATALIGGERHGNEGYFIQPTIFSDVKPDHKIMREEIFGPVVAVAKFKDEEDIIKQANDSFYGLAAAVFSKDINRAITTAHRLQSGTVWVNQYSILHTQMPFGGYKQSGIGRELGEYGLQNYTAVKAVHVNLGAPAPV